MRAIISIILFFLSVNAFSQSKIIVGRVFESSGNPLFGVLVSQNNNRNTGWTDRNGIFHLLIDEELEDTIILERKGYLSLQINQIDTISSVLSLIMQRDSSMKEINYEEYYNECVDTTESKSIGLHTSVFVDYSLLDFSNFESTIQKYNSDFMDYAGVVAGFEMDFVFNKLVTGISYGYSLRSNSKHDSLKLESLATQLGFSLGYNLISSERILLTPKLSIKWNRYQLENSDKQRQIPIAKYSSDRDIDMRFNQLTAFAGLSISYKMYNNTPFSTDYWTFGLFGGYLMSLNDSPWVYSKGNRLLTNKKISVSNYSFGMLFSFNID